MKTLAVKIENEQQFKSIVDFNYCNGFKMIGGINTTYDHARNVVETGPNFRNYCGDSPYGWTNKIVSFATFKQLNTIMN